MVLRFRSRCKLTFDARQKSRLRARLASGEEVALLLPRGEVLRGGDLVAIRRLNGPPAVC